MDSQLFRATKNSVYLKDVAMLKKFNDNTYKLVLLKTLRERGWEEANPKRKKNEAENDKKLASSLSRTKARVYELAICNEWELFVTLTLDKTKAVHDRHDLALFSKKLGKFIRSYNAYHETKVKYLLIPEPHEDGAWHMHGLIMGLPMEHLQEFTQSNAYPTKSGHTSKKAVSATIGTLTLKGSASFPWLPSGTPANALST